MIKSFPLFFTKSVLSTWPSLEPFSSTYLLKHSYNALKAYFNKDSFQKFEYMIRKIRILKIWGGGYSKKTSSKKPFKKAHLTSIWKSLMPMYDANAKRMQMASKRATVPKFSSKSIPSSWLCPFATNLVLFLATFPLLSKLWQNTHFVLITGGSLGRDVRNHTWFLSYCPSSSCIAITQFGSFIASKRFFGSMSDTKEENAQKFRREDLVRIPVDISVSKFYAGWYDLYL